MIPLYNPLAHKIIAGGLPKKTLALPPIYQILNITLEEQGQCLYFISLILSLNLIERQTANLRSLFLFPLFVFADIF